MDRLINSKHRRQMAESDEFDCNNKRMSSTRMLYCVAQKVSHLPYYHQILFNMLMRLYFSLNMSVNEELKYYKLVFYIPSSHIL